MYLSADIYGRISVLTESGFFDEKSEGIIIRKGSMNALLTDDGDT